MQTAKNTLLSIATGIAGTHLAHMISELHFDGILRPLGLARRSYGWTGKLAFLGAGIAIGGAAAMLLAPASWAEIRREFAKKADKLSGAAAQKAQAIGEHLRAQGANVEESLERNHGFPSSTS